MVQVNLAWTLFCAKDFSETAPLIEKIDAFASSGLS
jgi:hypothetical protein